jgi:hypothetical protein
MKKMTLLLVAAVMIFAAACSPEDDPGTQERARDNVNEQQSRINEGVQRIQNAQQVPVFDWSQEYQTLLDALTIRATGVVSTTGFYMEGVGLVNWCPSIGAPVPSTYQSTGSQQYIDIHGDGTEQFFPFDQAEPTGVIVGSSNATWTICVDDAGNKFGVYWEGPVGSVIATDSLDSELRLEPSDLTFEFTENPEED